MRASSAPTSAKRLPNAPRPPNRGRTPKAWIAPTSRTIRRAIPIGGAETPPTTTTDSSRSRSPRARCATICSASSRSSTCRCATGRSSPSLIDALDDDGYLHSSLEEVAELFPDELDIDPDELSIALRYLQSFEPAGIGARDAAECLTLQLKALPATTPLRAEALKLVAEHLPLLAARDFTKLKRLLHCDDATVRQVRALIMSLSPRPGASFAKSEANYVIPDVVVRKVRGKWTATLNEAAMPKLRLNRIYADILTRNRDTSNQQLAAQLQEAKWLIRNVQQRFETILRVAQAIVERQRRFFEHGEVAMRPMVLREIADMLDLHESTISRVTTQKYMLTTRGTYELKYFFGSHVATDTGGAASATAIRALIKQLIGAEDAKTPLTDSRIADLLGDQGILVARRTIAKYREALSIPPVNLRRAP